MYIEHNIGIYNSKRMMIESRSRPLKLKFSFSQMVLPTRYVHTFGYCLEVDFYCKIDKQYVLKIEKYSYYYESDYKYLFAHLSRLHLGETNCKTRKDFFECCFTPCKYKYALT